MRNIAVQPTVLACDDLGISIMHIEPRLWTFTRGVRLRIAWTVLIGLVASALGVARLGLLGWLIGALFAGQSLEQLLLPTVAIAAAMVLGRVFEHLRALI